MNTDLSREVSGLLKAWGRGQASALDGLIRLVYPEQKRLARRWMRSKDCGSLQTTSIVHEAYIRMVDMNGSAAKLEGG